MSELLVSLVTFAAVSTVSPGGATTLATASGACFGYVRSLPLITGIAVGLGSLVGGAAVGLASIVKAVPNLDLWLRIAGSAYLLWLAVLIGRQGTPGSRGGAEAPLGLLAGLLLLWANPKAWTMALAAAGTYTALADDPLMLAVLVGGVFFVAASASLTAWCLGGAWLARAIRADWQWRALNIVFALLLAGSVVLMWW